MNGQSSQNQPNQINPAYLKNNPYHNNHLSVHYESKMWKRIIKLPQWRNITYLKLYSCKITNADVADLIATDLPYLSQLSLYSNAIGDGMNYILESKWPHLHDLDVGCNQIQAMGISKIVSCSFTTQLQILKLMMNPIGCRGIKFLVKADFSLLENLALNECQLNNDSIQHLAKARFPKLQHLDISQNFIGCQGYKSLTFLPLKQMICVTMGSNLANCFLLYGVGIQSSKKGKIYYFSYDEQYKEWIKQQIIVKIYKKKFSVLCQKQQ